MPVIESEIKNGEALQVGNYQITPQTRLLKVRFPGYHAALIWNRPHAVIVRSDDGNEGILPGERCYPGGDLVHAGRGTAGDIIDRIDEPHQINDHEYL